MDVTAGGMQTATIRLERLVDLPARGWYSGDSHVHDLHQGFGLTHEAFFRQLVAEDLNVTHALIHMDGTRLMGRWADLTGKPSPLSTTTHILQYAQEFRGGLGHVGMIGMREFILPFVAGAGGTAYAQPSLETHLPRGRARPGRPRRLHAPVHVGAEAPANAASTLIALDVALGLGDYYDIGALYSDELGSADFYYRLLNAGFRIPATGGTDNFSDVLLDPPPGSIRTFARISGPLTLASWMDAIKRGRTFFSTGPLCCFEVEGREPWRRDRPHRRRSRRRCASKADVVSIAPLDTLEILVNGDVVQTVRADRSAARDLRWSDRCARRRLGRARERAVRNRTISATTTRSPRRRRSTSCAAASGTSRPRTCSSCPTPSTQSGRASRSRRGVPTRSATRSAPPSIARSRSIRSSVAR